MAEGYYEEHGGKTVFLGRFIPVARSVGFIVAGVAKMEWRRFIVYDVAGATVWGIGHAHDDRLPAGGQLRVDRALPHARRDHRARGPAAPSGRGLKDTRGAPKK